MLQWLGWLGWFGGLSVVAGGRRLDVLAPRLALGQVDGAPADVKGAAYVARLAGDFARAQLDGGWVHKGDIVFFFLLSWRIRVDDVRVAIGAGRWWRQQ